MRRHDAAVAQKISPKLAHSYHLMRFLSNKPWLVNAAARLGRRPWAQQVIG